MKKVILAIVLLAPLGGLALYLFWDRGAPVATAPATSSAVVQPNQPAAPDDTTAPPPQDTTDPNATKESVVTDCVPQAALDIFGKDLDIEYYTKEQFYEAMNGGAEVYLKRGIKCYVRAVKNEEVVLELFRFNNNTAPEVFVWDYGQKGSKSLEIGDASLANDNGIICASDGFLIQMYQNDPLTPETTAAFVKQTSAMLPLLPPLPPGQDIITKLFPPKGLDSVITIQGPWLGLAQMTGTRLATYKIGKDFEARGFVRRFLTSQEASQLFKTWPKLLKWDIATTKELKSSIPDLIIGAGFDPDPDRGWTVLFIFGRIMGGLLLKSDQSFDIGKAWAEELVIRSDEFLKE